jgi:hypothetical protein
LLAEPYLNLSSLKSLFYFFSSFGTASPKSWYDPKITRGKSHGEHRVDSVLLSSEKHGVNFRLEQSGQIISEIFVVATPEITSFQMSP